ncbi:MAG: response regulator [Bacteroidota bacterium]
MSTPNQTKNPLSILIADDEDPFRLVIREILTGNGFKVEAVDSGESAIDALGRQRFDVVVLDYKMPGSSGLNVLQWMVEQKMDTPVIMLTAAGSEFVAVEAMKYGAYDYLRKEHIDINHLEVIINGVYERYQFRKEKERREHIERERALSLVAVEIFHNTLASLAHTVSASLGKASTALDQTENALAPFVRNEGRQLFLNAFSQLKQEYGAIAEASMSMLRAANLLHGNFTDSKYASDIGELMAGKNPPAQQDKVDVTKNP